MFPGALWIQSSQCALWLCKTGRQIDTAVRLPDDIFEEKSGQLQGNLTTPKGLLAKSVVRARGHARLDLDGDRGWRRTVDAHSPRTMASDQWLVRFSFRPLRLSRHRLGPAALRRPHRRMGFARCRRSLLYRRPHCLNARPWFERITSS
jgi:hypothetical protein